MMDQEEYEGLLEDKQAEINSARQAIVDAEQEMQDAWSRKMDAETEYRGACNDHVKAQQHLEKLLEEQHNLVSGLI